MAAQIFAYPNRDYEGVIDCGVVSGNGAIEERCKDVALDMADIYNRRVVVKAVDYEPISGLIYSDNVRYTVAWDAKYQRFAIPPAFRNGAKSTLL